MSLPSAGRTLLAMCGVCAGLAGCPSAAPPPTAVEPPAPVPEATPSAASQAETSGTHLQIHAGEAVPIQLTFTTVGALHQGYFRRDASVRKLGEAFGACTDTTVEVQVVWSQKDLEGRIVGQVPQGTSLCVPRSSETAFDLTPVIPATQGLARYRDRVAGLSDFRIANFAIAVDLRGQGAFCRLRAVGQHPVDGTRFHPCVELNGERVCAEGDRTKGVTALRFADASHARRFAACL